MRSYNWKFIVVLLVSIAISGGSMNADDSISLESFNKLSGQWVGDGFGGTCEEMWSPASGNSIVGTFKLVKEDQTVFYEIMTITKDTTGFVLKVKHFTPDLIGWEEKDKSVTFRFIEMEQDKIIFDGLIYHFISEEKLDIIVSMKSKDGKIRQETIHCTRK